MAAEEGEIKYQTQTVKAVRGLEARTAAKWERQGWEVVSQETGRLSSQITLRRPKSKTAWWPFAILGGVLVGLAGVVIVMTLVTGSETASPASSSSPSAEPITTRSATPSSTPTPTPTPTSTPAPPGEAADAVVVDTTVDELLDRLNSPEMGGISLGEQFRITGELMGSEYWYTGVTGDFVVLLSAHGGADDLMILLDEGQAAGWTDGMRVEMVVQNVEKTVAGDTSDGWLELVTARVVA